MPDDTYDDDDTTLDQDTDDTPEPQTQRRNWRRDLEAKAGRADVLERENAFLKAGINPEDPRLGYFVRGYQGAIDPKEIRSAAAEAGFLDSRDTSAELAAVARIAEATGGAEPAGSTDPTDMNALIRRSAGRR